MWRPGNRGIEVLECEAEANNAGQANTATRVEDIEQPIRFVAEPSGSIIIHSSCRAPGGRGTMGSTSPCKSYLMFKHERPLRDKTTHFGIPHEIHLEMNMLYLLHGNLKWTMRKT